MILSLIKKEIRLQRTNLEFAMAIVVLWILLFIISTLTQKAVLSLCIYHVVVIIPAFLIFIPVSLGASAVASERVNGVIHRQFSFPVSRRTQWIIKMGVCVTISLILVVIILISLDVMMFRFFKETIQDLFGPTTKNYENSVLQFKAEFWPGIYALFFTALGLYMSSISNDALKALTKCLVLFLLSLLGTELISNQYSIMDMFGRTIGFYFVYPFYKPDSYYAIKFYIRCCLLSFTLFGLGYTNYYPEGFSLRRIGIHAVIWFGVVSILAYYKV